MNEAPPGTVAWDGRTGFPRKFHLLIVDEAHNCAPPGVGRYATDSERTQALRLLVPHFEHKLFLTATPHNGYPESFSALLELLDNQRFARSTPPDRKRPSAAAAYQRLGPMIDEALRGHLRAAIRRRIIEADGPSLVRAGTGTMADYDLEELRETFRSVMRKGARYDREDVIHSLARHLGFVRVTDTILGAIKSAINSAIRHGLLGYEGRLIWREG